MKSAGRWILGLLLVGLPLLLWAAWFEPASLRVREHTIQLEDWPPTAELRVALLADIHTGSPFNGLGRLHRIVEATNGQNPDLVLLAGDFVIHGVLGGSFVSPGEIAQVLANLQAPLGVFAVLGNHDNWLGRKAVTDALTSARIRVLEDQAIPISARGLDLWLVGLGDEWTSRPDIPSVLEGVPETALTIAFTHNPDLFPRIPSSVDLTLAGHTHGGQVSLPLVGPLVVPSRYGQRFAAGHIQEEGRHLFVSPGLGTSILPVRLGVFPEISLLRIAGRTKSP